MAGNTLEKIGTPRTMLTVKQVIEAFKDADGRTVFSDYMLRTLIREGKIPHVRLGNRKLLLCKETIDDWLKEQEIRSMIQPVEANKFGLRKL